MHLSKIIYGFLWFVTLICQNWYRDFSKLLHGFVRVFLWIPHPLPYKTKLKLCQDFHAYWSFCFELKVLSTHCLVSVVPFAMFCWSSFFLPILACFLTIYCILFHFLSNFLWVLILTVLLLGLHFRLLSFMLGNLSKTF